MSTITRTSWRFSRKTGRSWPSIRPAGSQLEALRAEFGASMGKLLPLLERIRQTDELIDAVVYRPYGLTEEEIRIVERGAS